MTYWRGPTLNTVGVSQGVGRLLDRIATPSVHWLPYPQGWGLPGGFDSSDVVKYASIIEGIKQEDYRRHFPDADPERIYWYDEVGRTPQFIVGRGGPLPFAVEIVRAPCRGFGMGIIERIAQWVRLQPLSDDGPVGPAIEITAPNGPQAPAVIPFGYNNGVTFFSSPFPFPLAHPLFPDNPAAAISVAFGVWHQGTGDESGGSLPVLTTVPTAVNNIPKGTPWKVWADSRYLWGSAGANHHKIMFGGFGYIRMWAAVFTAEADRWSVELGGRLTGYTQQAGYRGRAQDDATTRGY